MHQRQTGCHGVSSDTFFPAGPRLLKERGASSIEFQKYATSDQMALKVSPVAARCHRDPMAALRKPHVLALFMSQSKRDGVLFLSSVRWTAGFRTLGPSWLRVLRVNGQSHPARPSSSLLMGQIFESGAINVLKGRFSLSLVSSCSGCLDSMLH